MQLLILSDIHGNVSALESVLNDVKKSYSPDALALLGDFIDYGMRSDDVIKIIKSLDIPIVCNIWGNHERAVVERDYSHFSSPRGAVSAENTRKNLSADSLEYLENLSGKCGYAEFEFADMKFLAIHGSLKDPYWKAVFPDGNYEGYEKYDYVLSGHSHYAHVFPIFYPAENPDYRNKKRTFFINPGSVGQPRNHDPRAQYAVLDTERGVFLLASEYDIKYEQSLFTDDVDPFYSKRLEKGV